MSTQNNFQELRGGKIVKENFIQSNSQSKDNQSNPYPDLTETSMYNMQMDEGPGKGKKAQ